MTMVVKQGRHNSENICVRFGGIMLKNVWIVLVCFQ